MRHLGIVLFGIVLGCEHSASTPATASPEPAPVSLLEPADAPEDDWVAPTHSDVEQVLRIEGERTEAEVELAMREHYTELSHCFDLAVSHADRINADGAVVVKSHVTAAGDVRDAEVELSELGDAPTERCLAREVAHWHMAPAQADATVHMPFYMRSF